MGFVVLRDASDKSALRFPTMIREHAKKPGFGPVFACSVVVRRGQSLEYFSSTSAHMVKIMMTTKMNRVTV